MSEILEILEDGRKIVNLLTQEERKQHNEAAHQNRTCIGGMSWNARVDEGNYFLLGVLDEEDNALATILAADAEFALHGRASINYQPYITSMIFDQQPRKLGDKTVVPLQFVPAGHPSVSGDTTCEWDITKEIKSWYEARPIAEEYENWDANNTGARSTAIEFIQWRQNA